jgi:hypothetical protein
MCKKILSSLSSLISKPKNNFTPPPASTPAGAFDSNAQVKLEDGSNAGGFVDGQVKLGLPDDKRKRKGVPGLSL